MNNVIEMKKPKPAPVELWQVTDALERKAERMKYYGEAFTVQDASDLLADLRSLTSGQNRALEVLADIAELASDFQDEMYRLNARVRGTYR